MKVTLWIVWALICVALAAYFGNTMFLKEDKSDFLIGEATHGHFQIEMACETCHTEAFGGKEVLQDACVSCHAEELDEAHDSHPKKKFTDPREAYRLKILDARYCVTCHNEHQKEQTHPMGVTLPDDYCYHCHKEVIENRESHKDLAFDSCASAGCHNFHDNRALYESFLNKNAGQPWLKEVAMIAATNATDALVKPAVSKETSKYQDKINAHPDITSHWQASSHAAGGVDCGGCHEQTEDKAWVDKPGIEACATCHKNEVKSFTAGKHGMRLSESLSIELEAIKPGESKMDFHHAAADISHGCNTCHNAHEFNTQTAAAERCLDCHADEHSMNFEKSKHAKLWTLEQKGEAAEGTGVNCATCHMPRLTREEGGKTIVYVQHNQNDNLRPNEKMIRSVCMNCHGLGFAINALADPELIKNNFSSQPGIHIESIDWAQQRENKD